MAKYLFSIILMLQILSHRTINADILEKFSNPELDFSEIVNKIPIGSHFENLIINHQFWKEMVDESLSSQKFAAFIQQDYLYVKNFLRAFASLSSRTFNEYYKNYFLNVSNEDWDTYFRNFNISLTSEMIPINLEYSNFQLSAAKEEYIGVALATAYPCFIVWAKFGKQMALVSDIKNKTEDTHKYYQFINGNSNGPESESIQKFINATNFFYRQLPNQLLKQKMVDTYLKALEYEFNFVETFSRQDSGLLYQNPTASFKFTDLATKIAPSRQNEFINHELFSKIVEGTLSLDLYKTFIQEFFSFNRGFNEALSIMGRRERDFELKKKLLIKNHAEIYAWIESQFKEFNFNPSYEIQSYTKGKIKASKPPRISVCCRNENRKRNSSDALEYVSFLLRVAKYGTRGEGLGAFFASNSLWFQMAQKLIQIEDLEKNPNHPYKSFITIQYLSNKGKNVETYYELVNNYYAGLNETNVEEKYKMMVAAKEGIYHQIQFVNGVYLLNDSF